jgi:Tfp pilus assembly protein PilO
MKILITNKKAGGRGVYVGRPSPLGNPFVLKQEAERERVIAQYEEWLRDQLKMKNERVRSELNRLYQQLVQTGQLELTCWCSPRKCHAEVIAAELARAARARGLVVEVEYR